MAAAKQAEVTGAVYDEWDQTAVARARLTGLRAAHARFYVGRHTGTEVWKVALDPERIWQYTQVEVTRQGWVWCRACGEEPCAHAGAVILRRAERQRLARLQAA